jgi:hypothetical protein
VLDLSSLPENAVKVGTTEAGRRGEAEEGVKSETDSGARVHVDTKRPVFGGRVKHVSRNITLQK